MDTFDFVSIDSLRTSWPLVGPALSIGLTQFVKKNAYITERWIPLFAVIAGLVLTLLVFGVTVPSFVGGLVLGFAAPGAYQTVKNVSDTKQDGEIEHL